MRFVPSRFAALLRSVLLLCPCILAMRAQGPDPLDAVLERAQAAGSAGHYKEAAGLYARATTLAPTTAELWSNRGIMEYLAGNDAACLRSLQHASKLDPTLFTAALFSGKAYVAAGQPAQALPFLHHAQKLRPADPEVLLTLGEAEAGLHHAEAAEGFYLQAAHTGTGNAKAWYGAGVAALEIIETNGSTLTRLQPSPVWAQALLAEDLFAQERPLEASDTYRAALAKGTLEQKAVLEASLQWTEGHAQALGLPPRSATAVATLTTTVMGASPSALCAEPAAAQQPACLFFAGDMEGSAAAAEATLRTQPKDAEALFWSVKAQERIAVAALSHFEDLSPQSAANYVLVGNLYRLQRQPDKALAEYTKALALDPGNHPALQGAILACLAANRPDQATTYAQTALAAEPTDPQLNLLMAEILEAGNKRAEEAPFLAKAAAVPPELQPRLHYLLGRVAEANGETAQAVQQFELALPGDKDGSIHYQLSRLYRKAGEPAEADRMLAEAKSLIAQHETDASIALRDTLATPQE